MAEKLKKTEAAESVTPAAPETAEAAYTVGEFAANAGKLFGKRANADLVTAAFKVGGRQTATLSEAKDIVGKFMNREVK
ncbi:MAG: hypothetical protein IJK52_09245 [Oscillospiraceae bacterium]|nr:hypothetical protein [Oscillospiraceae bacterium]